MDESEASELYTRYDNGSNGPDPGGRRPSARFPLGREIEPGPIAIPGIDNRIRSCNRAISAAA